MWKDRDFKNLFDSYQPTPPERVWKNIAYSISTENLVRAQEPLFNQSQRRFLAVASISSILFCGFLLRSTEQHTSSWSSNSLPYSLEEEVMTEKAYIPKLETKSEKKENTILAEDFRKRENRSTRSMSSASHEELSFQKELNALAELDRQIAQLSVEIADLRGENLSPSSWEEKPELLASHSESEKKANKNWNSYLERTAFQPHSNIVDEQTTRLPKPNLLSRLYITPYMGTNITHVSYQDKPAHNFFSEKAQFSMNLGYNAGIQLGYQFNKRWSIETGIGAGQYILGFTEDYGTHVRDGQMYIDQLDFPLLARYTFPLKKKGLPISLSLKGGLIYSNVIFYQVNYDEKFSLVNPLAGNDQSYRFNVDKSQYNSMQLGYSGGFDFDAFVSQKIAVNFSMLNSLVSQVSNFPLFKAEKWRPVQFSSSFSIGTKINF